jgi:hypothetical protein
VETQGDLCLAAEDLSRVFNAHVVAFGRLRALGVRLSDLIGTAR